MSKFALRISEISNYVSLEICVPFVTITPALVGLIKEFFSLSQRNNSEITKQNPALAVLIVWAFKRRSEKAVRKRRATSGVACVSARLCVHERASVMN